MSQDPLDPDSSDQNTPSSGDPSGAKVAKGSRPKATLQDIFSMALFCFLVLFVAYLGWNLVQILLTKVAS